MPNFQNSSNTSNPTVTKTKLLEVDAELATQEVEHSTQLQSIQEQLQQLIQASQVLQNQKQAEVESNKIRIIAAGGGRKPKLAVSEQIILTLVHLRQLTTFQMLGIQFIVSETTANDIFNY